MPGSSELGAATATPVVDGDRVVRRRWAVLGPDPEGLAAAAVSLGDPVTFCASAADLSGIDRPDAVIVPFATGAADDHVVSFRHMLDRVRALLAALAPGGPLAGTRVVVVTRRAVPSRPGEPVLDLAACAVREVIRLAGTGVGFVDLDDGSGRAAVAEALRRADPDLAQRGDAVHDQRTAEGDCLVAAPVGPWRLDVTTKGIDHLGFVACPEATNPLPAGQVRIAMRAAGVNFRDVLNALGLDIGEAAPRLGVEGSGIVAQVGPGVSDLAPGDRVMGLFAGAFGPVAVTDRRLVVNMPDGWSFVDGAAVPVAFVTAYYGLVDLARLRGGQSVLVHAAAGGVGVAAVQLARHLGAEVFGTASPAKWQVLRDCGLAEDHIASSRSVEFEDRFGVLLGGAGVDVVLNSLTGRFVDASLRLQRNGGRFLEIGKTDLRSAQHVAAEHPGVRYHAFDLRDAGPDRLQEILRELSGLFRQGVLRPPPLTTPHMREARGALYTLRHGRHVGKVVLRLPSIVDAAGTVLVAGDTGDPPPALAEHLVTRCGARRVLLAEGGEAAGSSDLAAALVRLGANVRAVRCDIADGAALESLLREIPAAHPLNGVVYAAPAAVRASTVDAMWRLHALTLHADLPLFLLVTPKDIAPAAGAVRAFRDALVTYRRSHGLNASGVDRVPGEQPRFDAAWLSGEPAGANSGR